MAASAILSVGSDLQVMWDDCVVDASKTTASRVLHHPEYAGPAFDHSEPWEGCGSDFHNILTDCDERGPLFRMYYLGFSPHFVPKAVDRFTNVGIRVCYAESRDGIRWVKPMLGLVDYDGTKDNNIIFDETENKWDNFMVFKDANPACPPERRYKAIARTKGFKDKERIHPEGTELGFYYSADGIHFRKGEWVLLKDLAFDTLNVCFWDAVRGEYHLYVRGFHRNDGERNRNWLVRDIRHAVSRDEVVDGMYRVPSTYSFFATYVGDIELNGTYRLGWHNDNEVRSVFSGNVTGAGSVFIPNWSEQMQFSGDAFGLSGDIRFDPDYGSFVIVQSKTVTCAMNAYVTPEDGGWNVNCRNNVAYSGRGVVFGPPSPGEAAACTKELAFRAMKGFAGANADGTRYGDTLIPFGGRRIRIGELTGGFHAVASRLDQFCSGQRAGKPGLLRSLTYWGRGEVAVDAMKANSYVYLSTNVDMTAGTVGSNVRFDYTLQSNAVNGATLTIAGDCATSALLVARDVSMLPARVSGFAGEVVLTDTDEKTYAVTLDLSKGTSGGAYNVGGCVGSGRLTSAPEKGTLNVKLTGERTVSGDYAIVRFTSGGALLDGWTVNVADERRGKRDCTLVRDSTGIWLRANAKGFAISVN